MIFFEFCDPFLKYEKVIGKNLKILIFFVSFSYRLTVKNKNRAEQKREKNPAYVNGGNIEAA